MSTASLVVGIIGVITGLIPLLFIISLPCGIIAFSLGLGAWRKGRRVGVKQGRAGTWLGAAATVLGIAGIVIVAGAFDDLDEALDEGLKDDGGVETSSDNEANPPPADINDDLSCATQEIGGAKASGTLTNNSSQLSGYMISVGFLDEAGVRVADGTAFVNGVQPGQTATWEAIAFNDAAYATCEIVSVERLVQ